VFRCRFCLFAVLFGAALLAVNSANAQIDPTRRELFQFGYNQSIQGSQPLSAYAFFYVNKPGAFDNTNLTWRLALAPVYADSELGIKNVLGPNTDIGIGLAGGGFADSYYDIRNGRYRENESFTGDGVTGSSSLYHLFNPQDQIPLNGILRGEVHYADYIKDDTTAYNFIIPKDQTSLNVRTGFRYGGQEPVLSPDLAMELSLWYEGSFRMDPCDYGFHGERNVRSSSHLFWGRALLVYTLPDSHQNFLINLTAGTSASADRLSAYRIGGFLPLSSEFPLMIPGYYYQELSATRFALLNVKYTVPIDPDKRFSINAVASTSIMSYLPGLSQSGSMNSGVGGGLGYRSHSGTWDVMLDCGYGIDAVRDRGRGAETVGLLMQINLEPALSHYFDPSGSEVILRGLDSFMRGVF
jgi:hypothetical protein